MKLKLLPLVLMSFMLGACGSNEPTPTTTATPASESQPYIYQYLTFVSDKNVRFELFDLPEGLQIRYGNKALDASKVENVALDDNARLSVNKDLTGEDFQTIIVTEKASGSTNVQVLTGIDCTQLVEYFRTAIGDDLVGADRAYVTFTKGASPKWTKGLNAAMDKAIEGKIIL